MSTAAVEDFLAALPEDRRETIAAVRAVILDNLPDGYEEGMQYGQLGYFVPHSLCPDGYHCNPKQPVPFAGIANGKAKISLHLFGIYVMPGAADRFREAWKATGKKLDMGASCVRFKKLEDVPLDVVAETIRALPVQAFLEQYEASLPEKVRKKRGGGRR